MTWTREPIVTYTRYVLETEPDRVLWQRWIDGRPAGIVYKVPAGYCEACGARKPAGQSCLCFDNGCQ